MCGIAGYYSKKNRFRRNDLEVMAQKISHRGPDAEGFYDQENVGLAHKRLSIIDLSEAANQPMSSQCGRYVIVFNGEIYNYKSLRQELSIDFDIHFKTNSDTETILEGFVKWGPKIFDKLCGMFAMAIYDKAEVALIICRDRIGIKPLYYFMHDGDFAFASELKSLKAVPYINNHLCDNPIAINAYLHLGYIPEPYTIYEKINKFPAGHYAVIKNGGHSFHKYWQLNNTILPEVLSDKREAKDRLKALLKKIVQEHLICDVPFGTFLSGGIDSSLVTALANEVSEKPLHSFSIGFAESKYNESHYAQKVAKHLGTVHHEMFVTEKEAIEIIPKMYDIYDEPFADSSAIPTYMVSKMTRQHVTMALSGDGGDELFLGYGAYLWANRLNKPLWAHSGKFLSKLLSLMGSRYKRIAKVLDYPDNTGLKSHIFSQEQYLFSQKEVGQLLNKDFVRPPFIEDNSHKNIRELSAAEAQSLFDINYYLKDDLLVKVDRASMQHALEVRVPLLDHRLVEFAVNLHPSLRLKGKTTKYLLKQVLFDYVPPSFFDRPKWGFSIPLEKWMKNELKDYINDILSPDIIKKHGFVNQAEVNKLKELFEKPRYAFLYNRIWTLAVLHDFLEKR